MIVPVPVLDFPPHLQPSFIVSPNQVKGEAVLALQICHKNNRFSQSDLIRILPSFRGRYTIDKNASFSLICFSDKTCLLAFENTLYPLVLVQTQSTRHEFQVLVHQDILTLKSLFSSLPDMNLKTTMTPWMPSRIWTDLTTNQRLKYRANFLDKITQAVGALETENTPQIPLIYHVYSSHIVYGTHARAHLDITPQSSVRQKHLYQDWLKDLTRKVDHVLNLCGLYKSIHPFIEHEGGGGGKPILHAMIQSTGYNMSSHEKMFILAQIQKLDITSKESSNV